MAQWPSGQGTNYHAGGRRFNSRFGLVISDVPPVYPAVMDTYIAESQRLPGVVLVTSHSCVPWLWKLVCPTSYQPDGSLRSGLELWLFWQTFVALNDLICADMLLRILHIQTEWCSAKKVFHCLICRQTLYTLCSSQNYYLIVELVQQLGNQWHVLRHLFLSNLVCLL